MVIKKEIGVYNIDSERFIEKGKLKTQGAKKFFYGEDGVLEDKLSEWEGRFANCINEILKTKKVPESNKKEYTDLLAFVVTTHLRNPVLIDKE